MFWDLEKIHQRVSRLRENAKAASLQLPPETVAKLDAIGTNKAWLFSSKDASPQCQSDPGLFAAKMHRTTQLGRMNFSSS